MHPYQGELVEVGDMYSVAGETRVSLESEPFGRGWCGNRRTEVKVDKDALESR